jgi:hypothetical protein
MKDTGINKMNSRSPSNGYHFIKSNELNYYKVTIDYPFAYTTMQGIKRNGVGGIFLKLGEGFDEVKVKLTPDETIHLIVLLQEAFKHHHMVQEEVDNL